MFEIGNSLREARVRQGLDYPQVELATKIRAKYVRALEDEEFAVLPAQPYVKGFLRTYADFLGLDGQLYVDEYNSRFVADGVDETPLRRVSPRVQRERGIERKVVLLALAGIAALTALVIIAWKFGGGDSSTPPVVPQQAGSTHRPSELQLTGVGRGTYVEVRRGSATGAVLLQATVPGGKVERVTGSRFWLYVKHPASVRVRLAGKAVSLPARANLKVVVTPSRTALAGG
ncbi:MAG: helix-turn-helix transcriptional regulator [Gaiellaceae bacterium]